MRYPASAHISWQEWTALAAVLLFVASMLALMAWAVITVAQYLIRVLHG